MTSINPYQPPQSAVADAPVSFEGAYQEMKIWDWRGRVGRLRFLAYGFVAYLVLLILMVVVGAIASAAGAGAGFDVVLWILLIPYVVFIALVTIRRSHDMGWSGWMSLLALVPLVGLLWLFKAGSPAANRFGPPPPPNSTGVKLATGIFGAIFLLGILAAVALPAYQQYVQRAGQAAQQAPAR